MVGQRPKFYSGSFKDVLFWFLRGHSDSDMGRTSDVHRWDFLGLKTSMRRLISRSVQSDSIYNSPILSGNIRYIGILIIWLFISYYMHYASSYVTYWVSYSHLFLHCRWYCRYLSWGRGVDFWTAASVYEHFVAVVFWLRVLRSFLIV